MIKSYEPSLVGIPFLQKDVSTNLFPRISQRAHIKYFIQFRVSPLLPLLAHHTECHLYFVFSSLVSGKCSKWNVTLSPWIWHLSRCVTLCWPQGQLITRVWILTSLATGRATAPTAPMCGHAATKEMHTQRIRKPGQDWFSSTSILLVFQLR